MRKTLKQIFSGFDEKGNVYVVYIYVDLVPAGTLNNPHAEMEGLMELVTERGEHLNYVSEGKYKFFDGTLLSSNDPDAP